MQSRIDHRGGMNVNEDSFINLNLTLKPALAIIRPKSVTVINTNFSPMLCLHTISRWDKGEKINVKKGNAFWPKNLKSTWNKPQTRKPITSNLWVNMFGMAVAFINYIIIIWWYTISRLFRNCSNGWNNTNRWLKISEVKTN